MTDRHSQILEALGLGPRWLPAMLPGAAPVAAEEAEPPSQALAEFTAPSVPVAQASIVSRWTRGRPGGKPTSRAPAAPRRAHAECRAQADAAPAAVIDARVLAPSARPDASRSRGGGDRTRVRADGRGVHICRVCR